MSIKRIRRTTQLVCLISLLALSLAYAGELHAGALAQESDVTANDVTANEVNDIAQSLWCPLCSGVRLDSCYLSACIQMKDEIALMLEEGKEESEIQQYFLDQYGPQILGEPPREGFNLLAWILPFLVLLGGAVFLVLRLRPTRRVAPAALASTGDSAASAGDSAVSAIDDDPLHQRLKEELSQYD